MIRILLAEDHHIVRKGIASILKDIEDFEIIGEVEDGQAAVSFAFKHKPDVVLMDINMPNLNGIQAAEQIRASLNSCQVVILSQYSEEAIVRQALRAGAKGYLIKQSLVEELQLAIRSVYRGKTYLSPDVSDVLLDNYLDSDANLAAANPLNKLSSRERQVMQLVAEGNTNKVTAQKLNVTEKTVEKHRKSIMTKLHQKDLAGLIRTAIKFGLIFLDE